MTLDMTYHHSNRETSIIDYIPNEGSLCREMSLEECASKFNLKRTQVSVYEDSHTHDAAYLEKKMYTLVVSLELKSTGRYGAPGYYMPPGTAI